MRWALGWLAVATAVAGGCATSGESDAGARQGEQAAAFADRAAVVVEAWRHTPAAAVWHSGFVPMQELTLSPSGFPGEGAKLAFAAGWYRLGVAAPDIAPRLGVVRFVEGSTLPVPVASGLEAYRAIDLGDPPCDGPPVAQPPESPLPGQRLASRPPCDRLTVTGFRLGTATLRTSRGAATVPAWHLTVAELREPVVRVAVAASALTPLPSEPIGGGEHGFGFVNAERLTGVDGDELTFDLVVGSCQHNFAPLVYESADAVVLGGTGENIGGAGVCDDVAHLVPVTATLSAPLGNRVVLEPFGGRPLVLTVG